MKNAVFWDVTPCGSCKNPCKNSCKRFLQEPRGVTSQKTPFFIYSEPPDFGNVSNVGRWVLFRC
jgi:hypothetical protein